MTTFPGIHENDQNTTFPGFRVFDQNGILDRPLYPKEAWRTPLDCCSRTRVAGAGHGGGRGGTRGGGVWGVVRSLVVHRGMGPGH